MDKKKDWNLELSKYIKQEEIAKKINKSVRTAKTIMMEMQVKGLIERKNGKRNGEWVVKTTILY